MLLFVVVLIWIESASAVIIVLFMSSSFVLTSAWNAISFWILAFIVVKSPSIEASCVLVFAFSVTRVPFMVSASVFRPATVAVCS